MEEKRNLKAEMKTMPSGQQTKKLSYDELEKVAISLKEKCQSLYNELMEVQSVLDKVNAVGILLSVLDKSQYFDKDFVSFCSTKVQDMVSSAFGSEKPSDSPEKK